MRAPPTRSWKAPTTISPADSLVGGDPTPPAAVSLLLAADSLPVQTGAMLYASPALTFDGNVVGYTVRRFGVMVPVAAKYSRLFVTRCGYGDPLSPTTQLPHLHGSTTGGGYAGASLSKGPSAAFGGEIYLDTDPALALIALGIATTGTKIDNAPATQSDRALLTPNGLAPVVEVYQVEHAAGVGLQIWQRTGNLETL